MSEFVILSDSCCDLPKEMVAELKIGIAPLSVQYDENTVFNDGDMDPKAFYNGVRSGKMPKSAAVNPDGWKNKMVPALKEGKDVLVLAFASALSATYQSAVIAADELAEKYPDRKILVVDTRTATVAHGLLVWRAAKMRDAGESIETVCAWVRDHALNSCVWLTVNDLMHLKRGGRLSATTAIVGSLLQIKPILMLDDEGKLQTDSKARGRKAAMNYIVNKLAKTGLPGENDTVFVAHGDCLADAETLAAMVKEHCGVKNVIISYVGNVIGTHTGPDVLVLAYLGEHR